MTKLWQTSGHGACIQHQELICFHDRSYVRSIKRYDLKTLRGATSVHSYRLMNTTVVVSAIFILIYWLLYLAMRDSIGPTGIQILLTIFAVIALICALLIAFAGVRRDIVIDTGVQRVRIGKNVRPGQAKKGLETLFDAVRSAQTPAVPPANQTPPIPVQNAAP